MIIKDLEGLKSFALSLKKLLKKGDVINLIGGMGAGKTTLVNFIAKAFGISDSSSPTFSIVNVYEGDEKIYHLDLYRFDSPDDILDIDFEEYFYPEDALTFIEWAERTQEYLPDGMINIEFEKIDENKRKLTIRSDSKRGREINEYFSN
ncbi:MAG: tRNA (adenosine(37)-N6)-threonylcarbamoyltransferase complex ATPase subunit type 1 TsaE [Anaerococcus sp.]|nr:tRNA (adenosine(37)-N6)-threonylcarbamoyltransferase complex ATPase subunit type 1 TsaE [Anaerococcus sp.]